jgi:proline iminopeptidase
MSLFPECSPRHSGFLDVGDGHALYYEESGHPEGTPVVVCHGGPGAASAPHMRRYFDPACWRIILFDQRGAGRSRAADRFAQNTPAHLVEDMERLRRYLNIETWLVWGGSWGATLALLYAETHPDRSLGLVLRGTFLARRRDLDWLLRDGANRFFPDAWARLVEPLPEHERADPVSAYHHRLVAAPGSEAETWARRWNAWESACSTLVPPEPGNEPGSLALAQIECHYFHNENFLPENTIIDRLDTIRHLPAILVHGRYDMVCPPEQSALIAAAWPNAELRMIEQAGHSAREPGIEQALVAAARDMGERL